MAIHFADGKTLEVKSVSRGHVREGLTNYPAAIIEVDSDTMHKLELKHIFSSRFKTRGMTYDTSIDNPIDLGEFTCLHAVHEVQKRITVYKNGIPKEQTKIWYNVVMLREDEHDQ